jgi:hypothetical protein
VDGSLDAIGAAVRVLLAERLHVAPGDVPADAGASLQDLGLDSTAILSLVVGLEDRFDNRDPRRRDHGRQLRDRRRHHPLRWGPDGGGRVTTAQLASTVERFGTRPALVDGDRRLSWDELAEAVERRAAALAGRDIGPDRPLAIVLPNGTDFVVTFLACQRLGALAVPLNPLFTPGEVGRHLAGRPVGGIVTTPEGAPGIAGGVPNGTWVAGATDLDPGSDRDGPLAARRAGPARGLPLLVGLDGHAQGHGPHPQPSWRPRPTPSTTPSGSARTT